jgi:hypothetical protein
MIITIAPFSLKRCRLAPNKFFDRKPNSIQRISGVVFASELTLPAVTVYFVKPLTNSTRLRNAIPDGPLAIHGF